MVYRRKTWMEKLEDKQNYPKVLKLDKRFPCYVALRKMGVEEGQSVVLVNPSEVVDAMRDVPQGKLITLNQICRMIAKRHDVGGCCTLTAGIFIMTAANASEEAAREGRSLGIPYWRTLKADGYLNEKFPGGLEAHRKLLEREGFQIVGRGKRLRVSDYEKYLMNTS
jgi:alkylated DNA nucleotide flippase Atl1